MVFMYIFITYRTYRWICKDFPSHSSRLGMLEEIVVSSWNGLVSAQVIQNGTHFGGIKQYKSMAILKDFPNNNALFGLVSYNDP